MQAKERKLAVLKRGGEADTAAEAEKMFHGEVSQKSWLVEETGGLTARE